ncbi:MAG: lipid-A-disaccharide synthase, partial [Candidatus Zixiibacteriota bacterium]
ALIGAPYDADSRRIALLPGSRQQEVDRMLPTMLAAARALGDTERFTIAGVSDGVRYGDILADHPEFKDRIVYGITRETVADSALVISSSGTATLEIALIGRPLIVMYKANWLTYQIARRLVGLSNIALANIVAGKSVAPEFLQSVANPTNIAAATRNLLDSPGARQDALAAWSTVRRALGVDENHGASEKVADAVSAYL